MPGVRCTGPFPGTVAINRHHRPLIQSRRCKWSICRPWGRRATYRNSICHSSRFRCSDALRVYYDAWSALAAARALEPDGHPVVWLGEHRDRRCPPRRAQAWTTFLVLQSQVVHIEGMDKEPKFRMYACIIYSSFEMYYIPNITRVCTKGRRDPSL